MSAHKPTAINAWTYAAQFYSGDPATSSDYNQIVNNLSLMYARPYVTIANTVSQTLTTGANVFTSGSDRKSVV